jgi:hypothetical protein
VPPHKGIFPEEKYRRFDASPLEARKVGPDTSLPRVNMLSARRMKTFTLPAYLMAVALSLAATFAEDSQNGAKAALHALPPQFTSQIVRLSADNGRPIPKRWYVLARTTRAAGFPVRGLLYSVTIVRGELAETKPSLDARQVLNRNFIDLARVRIDSGEAFEIARNALGRAGEKMRSASYQLTQTRPATDPVWEVWAYGKSNRYLGVVKLSAATGEVISSRKALFSSL